MIVTLGSVNVPAIVFCALLALGATAGPIQPINAELAVEVTYTNDESAIEALQQVFATSSRRCCCPSPRSRRPRSSRCPAPRATLAPRSG